ncbi:Uu.00g079620.m01.CDS01 [Anthostomella pinea]|uniref:Uu.00g079620.m01.CDS01 n=1 Tax=Anthostomella pinea TaxID=933095 RepID=A0AAI8VLS7_9PEZI|nr:Uu.00g079620.m01.CDS01 [Anthostomella pinea]
MMNSKRLALGLLTTSLCAFNVDAFWRMTCGLIQTGRMDPVVFPGQISPHVHKFSGASNVNLTETYENLQASECTSCEIGADRSLYWTPQLYYQHADGTFEEVPNGGTVVYYLGRGENRTGIQPFPPGFKMVSGDPSLRSNDTTTMTYNDPSKNIAGRLVSDRVSFACLDSSGGLPEQNYMFRTDCDEGMRAQIHFPSCWNGQDFEADGSHVAYMSQIDNGVCPPTHPIPLIHLFFEMYYDVNNIKKDGGSFVFAQGDPTGFGFHGDFINGWDQTVLQDAIEQCVNNDSLNGVISQCPPLAKSQTPYASVNCPERQAIVNEQVKGTLSQLPGCNPVTPGPARAAMQSCPDYMTPSFNYIPDLGPAAMLDPVVGQKLGGSSWAFAGCANEASSARVLNGPSSSSVNMTIEACTTSCKSNGYPFAGLENSKECYCGNSLAPSAMANCTIPKMICAGNNTEWCGAPSFLTVWNDTSLTAATPLVVGSTRISNNSAVYAGCFSDPGGNSRALLGASNVDTVGMTNEVCVAFCQSKGYTIAGTEYSQECYCSNANTGTTIMDVTRCDSICKGDPRELCGSSGKMSVWNITQAQTGTPPPVTKPVPAVANGTASYVGCYTEISGRTLDKASYSSDTMSVDSCASFCQSKNYALFGVEYAQQCYCSNTIKSPSAVSAESQCSMACKGDPTQTCGGSSKLSIWNNTLFAPTHNVASVNGRQYAYLGCYTEGTNGRALGALSSATKSDSTTNKQMTIELCGSYCASKGFKYMGVEYGTECYCNNDGLVNGASKASETDCSMTCPGDHREWCGAGSRLSVYKAPGA